MGQLRPALVQLQVHLDPGRLIRFEKEVGIQCALLLPILPPPRPDMTSSLPCHHLVLPTPSHSTPSPPPPKPPVQAYFLQWISMDPLACWRLLQPPCQQACRVYQLLSSCCKVAGSMPGNASGGLARTGILMTIYPMITSYDKNATVHWAGLLSWKSKYRWLQYPITQRVPPKVVVICVIFFPYNSPRW